MAGSLHHLLGEEGRFTMEYLDNMGDASEALEECFHIILELSGGKRNRVNAACKKLHYPTIECDMKP